MADSDVEVKFGANLQGLQAGIDQATKLLEGVTGPIGGIVEAAKTAAEAVAAIFAVDKISEFVEHFANLGTQTQRTAALLGVMPEKVSALDLMAQASGGSLQEMTSAVERLGMSLARSDAGSQQAKAGLAALGITAKQLEALPLEGKMELLAQKFSVLKDGPEKDAIAMALLGRAGANMISVFNQGAQAIAQFQAMADRAGSSMTGPQLEAAEQLHLGILELGASFTGVGNTIATTFQPVFQGVISIVTDVVEWFNKAISAGGSLSGVMNAIKIACQALETVLVLIVGGFRIFVDTASASIAIVGDAWTLGTRLIVEALMQPLQVGKTIVMELADMFSGLGRIIKDVFTGNWGDIGSAAQSMMASMKGDFTVNTAGMQAAWNDFTTKLKANGQAALASFLETGRAESSELTAIWTGEAYQHEQIAQTSNAKLKEINKDLVNSQLKDIDGQIKTLQEALKTKVALYNEEASTFQITQNQKFAMIEQETNAEYNAEMDLLKQKAAIAGQTLAQQQQTANQIKELWQKHQLDMINLDKESIAAQQQQWTTFLNTIESSFNSQLRGLLAGTTTWSQAFKTMCGDMIIKFIEMCETMVVKWAAAQLAQTTAATTGAAASAAAQESASSAGILSMAANAVRAIMTDAGQAFAGVFAFLAPVMGPAAAGPAAAAQASVSAAAIFDVGTPEVLRSGMAMVHEGEAIVPAWARGSGPWPGGAGKVSPTVHVPMSINVSALDSQSVARFFGDNSKHMLRAINDAVKRGAHLGLNRLGH